MTQTVTISDDLTTIAALVKSGDMSAAKRATGRLLDHADPDSLTIIVWCGKTLQNNPYSIAREKMRNAWFRAPKEEYRALIEACAPEADNGAYLPDTEQAAQRYGRGPYQAPRNSHRRIDPTRRTTVRRRREEPAVVADYISERGGVDDAPPRTERPDGYTIDYDKAAVYQVRGLPCLDCGIERARADAWTDRVRAGHGDDGLCESCRETGRAGIPELPTGHTVEDAIRARCAHILTHRPDFHSLMRHEWQQATNTGAHGHAALIHECYQRDMTTRCDGCGGIRQIRHGLCLDCRQLDIPAETALSIPARTAQPDAVTIVTMVATA